MLRAAAWLCAGALLVSATLLDQMHEHFIAEGRDDDYLILERADAEADSLESVEEDEAWSLLADREKEHNSSEEEHDLHEDDEDEEDHLVTHSLWTTGSEADAMRPYGHHRRCPPVAPASSPDALDACDAPECSLDDDCEVEERCCHNGCVRTCTAMDPAIEIDWLDHSSDFATTTKAPSSSMQHAVLAPHLVTMAGGCVLTLKQFRELANFRKSENINRCFCEKGGVFCEVARNFPSEN